MVSIPIVAPTDLINQAVNAAETEGPVDKTYTRKQAYQPSETIQMLHSAVDSLPANEGFTVSGMIKSTLKSYVNLMEGLDTGDARPEDALAVSGSSAGAGLLRGAEENAVGMFGGRIQSLRREMYAKDNMVGEMSDVGARIASIKPDYKGTLGDIVDHPELFQAYPELKNLPVRSHGINAIAAYEPAHWMNGDQPSILLGDRFFQEGVTQQRETLLHEIQHAVADIDLKEGTLLPGGTNYNDAFEQGYSAVRKFLNSPNLRPYMSADEIRNIQRISNIIDKHVDKYAGGVKTFQAGEELYRKDAGEVLARNVSRRSNMTQRELEAAHPWITQDIPIDEVVDTLDAQVAIQRATKADTKDWLMGGGLRPPVFGKRGASHSEGTLEEQFQEYIRQSGTEPPKPPPLSEDAALELARLEREAWDNLEKKMQSGRLGTAYDEALQDLERSYGR